MFFCNSGGGGVLNIGSYHGNMVHVVNGEFLPCVVVGVLSGSAYFWAGSWSVSSVWLLLRVFEQTKLKPQKQDCMQTYIFIKIKNHIRK